MHVAIFSLLPFQDRLTVTSSVCKGWRSLRSDERLWRSIEVDETTFSAEGAKRLFTVGGASPLPSLDCVKELSLHGGTKITVAHLKHVLKACTAVTKLDLDGSRLSSDCIALLARGHTALTHLTLRKSTASGAKSSASAVLEILAACPNLTHLACCEDITSEYLFLMGQRASSARSQGRPLLSSLSLVDSYSSSLSLSPQALARLGATFPELEVVNAALRCHQEPAIPDAGSWALLPRLRELSLARILQPRALQTSDRLQALLRGIAAAASGLRLLSIDRGFDLVDHKAIRAGQDKYRPLPSIGPVLGGIGGLQQLEQLKLRQVSVSPSDALACDLPSLRSLSLMQCGPESAAAAAALASAAPLLTSLVLASWELQHENIGSASLMGGTVLTSSLNGLPLCPHLTSLDISRMTWQAAQESMHSIGRRAAAPALRSLKLAGLVGPPAPLFELARPWPELWQLSLAVTSASVAGAEASLAALSAPQLSSLLLPPLVHAGGEYGKVAPPYRWSKEPPPLPAADEQKVLKAYAKMAALSALPPLRKMEAEAGAGAGAAEVAAGVAAGARRP